VSLGGVVIRMKRLDCVEARGGKCRNPLAEPSVLGVPSGSSFGDVLAQILGLCGCFAVALEVAAFA
jgi:ABC-type cobalamin transport system permease subunit